MLVAKQKADVGPGDRQRPGKKKKKMKIKERKREKNTKRKMPNMAARDGFADVVLQ